MSALGLGRAEIAELAGVALPSVPEFACIARVSAIAKAQNDSLVFATDAASLAAALATGAGLILAPRALATGDDRRVMGVADPRYTFAVCARALESLQSRSEPPVHPTAVVDPGASLGARVRIGAGTVVAAGADVGDDSVLGRNVTVEAGVTIGARVVVQSGTVLGSKGFGYVRDAATGEYLLFPQQGSLVIEDDVEIGANTTIDRGALEETRIGRGTKIDNLVHIGHNCRIGRDVIIAAQVGISGSSVVEDGAVLAGQVGISDHCHIGPGVILGGQAGVYRGKTVTGPGEVFAGTPAEPLRAQMRSLARLRRLR